MSEIIFYGHCDCTSFKLIFEASRSILTKEDISKFLNEVQALQENGRNTPVEILEIIRSHPNYHEEK